MNETNNILEQSTARENPFTVPEGYFFSVEDSIGSRIAQLEHESRLMSVLKPAVLMAAMFGLIFFMGYGMLSVTGSVNRGSEEATLASGSQEGQYIGYDRLQFYYDDNLAYQENVQDIGEVQDNDIMDFLDQELSIADIAYILADLHISEDYD